MRLGGWWRLWITLSALWGAFITVVAYVNRPSSERVNREVGLSCGIETPMTEQYARDALRMRMLLDQLVIADAAKNEVSARRLAAEIASLRELWAENTGVRIKYSRFKVIDPGGGEHSAIAPLPATNAEVMAQIDVDKRDANNWASFSRYCIEELRIHANGELLRSRTKEWIRSSVLGGFLPPLIFLVFGALVSWIWRGFRPNKPA